jgi:hypothetical protein
MKTVKKTEKEKKEKQNKKTYLGRPSTSGDPRDGFAPAMSGS